MDNKLTAIGKTIEILKAFAKEPYSFSAQELSHILNINRTTVHRILNELEQEMLVVQNNLDKKYTIGPSMYHIGSKYLYRNNNFLEIRTIVDNIAVETKQNIGYTVIENDKIINLYESEIAMSVRITYQYGSYFPINRGAYGKTIMAFYKPKEKLEEIVRSSRLEGTTPNSITNPEELLMEYKKIREQGYTISDEENLLGALGIGVPIFNTDGNIHGCIALAAAKSMITEKSIMLYISTLKKGAREISKYIV
ncbi:MAG: Transcriptional regulator KdgR, KDG operon repressor [Clostridiales bacterium 38_11]|nr:MAG: Transcriptional regulator KdgR, KDG operon repressor [Clostridiales bacterium 38_11]